MSATAEERREQLVELFKEVKGCTKCPLHETRTKAVFGAGNADADLMFVGEAPGAEEDRQGLPFVGRAGQLLNQMLEEIGLSREDVFIANVLKSRPPGNRDPQPLEIEACEPYLFEQVRLIEPRVVCTLGNFATKLLSGSPTGITKVRGTPQVHELGGRTVFLLPLFHPAAALRTPAVKETLRADFATIPELLQRPLPGPAPSAEELAEAEEEGGSTPPPPSRPARLLRLDGRTPWRSIETSSAAETEALGARIAERLRARRRRPPLRRARGREDDPGPRRLPRARRHRPRHLADLHDRPALRRRRLPVSHLDLYRLQSLEGEDPALLEDYLRPGRGRLRRVAGGRRGPARPPGARGPPRPRRRGAAPDRSRLVGVGAGKSAPTRVAGVQEAARAACSIGARNSIQKGKDGMKGLKALAAVMLVSGLLVSGGARHGRRGGLQALRRLRGLPQRQTRARLPEEGEKGRLLQKPQRRRRLQRLRQVPEREKPLRPGPGSRTGDALREQDHLDDPRQATSSAGSSKARKSAPGPSGSRG